MKGKGEGWGDSASGNGRGRRGRGGGRAGRKGKIAYRAQKMRVIIIFVLFSGHELFVGWKKEHEKQALPQGIKKRKR